MQKKLQSHTYCTKN